MIELFLLLSAFDVYFWWVSSAWLEWFMSHQSFQMSNVIRTKKKIEWRQYVVIDKLLLFMWFFVEISFNAQNRIVDPNKREIVPKNL